MKAMVLPVKGYEGSYSVTRDGRVFSLKSNKYLKPTDNGTGYLIVTLCKNGKNKKYLVHRLIAEAFIPNPDNKEQVSHLDETRTNNCVENLCWATAEENNKMPLRLKRFTESKSKKCMCIETGEVYRSAKEAMKNTGITSISMALCGKTKTAGGYTWMYV